MMMVFMTTTTVLTTQADAAKTCTYEEQRLISSTSVTCDYVNLHSGYSLTTDLFSSTFTSGGASSTIQNNNEQDVVDPGLCLSCLSMINNLVAELPSCDFQLSVGTAKNIHAELVAIQRQCLSLDVQAVEVRPFESSTASGHTPRLVLVGIIMLGFWFC